MNYLAFCGRVLLFIYLLVACCFFGCQTKKNGKSWTYVKGSGTFSIFGYELKYILDKSWPSSDPPPISHLVCLERVCYISNILTFCSRVAGYILGGGGVMTFPYWPSYSWVWSLGSHRGFSSWVQLSAGIFCFSM